MKSTIGRVIWMFSVAVTGCLLISWSPPDGDQRILFGSGGTLGGFNGEAQGYNVSVLQYKGFIGGWGNTVGSGYLGTSGTNYRYNMLLGFNNAGNSQFSTICGHSNVYAPTGSAADSEAMRWSGLFGSYNYVNSSTTSILVAGYANTARASMAFAAGANNTIEGATAGSSTQYSAAIGFSNHVAAASGWTMGWNNYVSADKGVAIGVNSVASSTSAVAIGSGLANGQGSSVALGRYNQTMQAGDVVAIGTGSSSTERFTALRVTSDGGVILGRAQGDISMGAYAN